MKIIDALGGTMKKALLWLLAGAFIVSSLPVPGYGQEAGEILERMIKAQGGRKVLESLKDTTITGTMELIQQGMNATMTMYQKEPNLMRMDIEIMGMVITQAYDGQKGWFLNPQTGTAQEMDENMNKEFKRQALGNDSLLNPAKYGISYAFKGKEKVGDKECLVLEQTMSDGHKSTLYIDPDTHLIARTKTTTLSQMGGGEVQSETIFGDYRKEGDTVTAHTMTILQEGAEFARMTLTKIAFNTGIEDSLFQMSR
jgi:outer membrane lipoprotein-sorting protein